MVFFIGAATVGLLILNLLAFKVKDIVVFFKFLMLKLLKLCFDILLKTLKTVKKQVAHGKHN